MRTIRVQFQHFWRSFDWRRQFGFLLDRFDVVESDDPDFVIFSVFENGRNAKRMPRIPPGPTRIFYTAENVAPEMDHTDYAFGFAYEEEIGSSRYRRLPNYATRLWATGFTSEDLLCDELDVERVLAAKTRFCNFIYTNPRCETRNTFFKKLSRYRHVDAPAQVFQNMPSLWWRAGALENLGPKLDFARQCKFTIAFENESSPGYTTEKLVEPMLANSVPIYWGNPQVERDFDPKSFLSFFDGCRDLDDLIERVIAVDGDDALFAELLRRPWLSGNRLTPQLERDRVVGWFAEIFGA